MTTPASTMMKNVEQYLTHRRSLGYRFQSGGYLLRAFITLPYLADERLIGNLVEKAFAKHK